MKPSNRKSEFGQPVGSLLEKIASSKASSSRPQSWRDDLEQDKGNAKKLKGSSKSDLQKLHKGHEKPLSPILPSLLPQNDSTGVVPTATPQLSKKSLRVIDEEDKEYLQVNKQQSANSQSSDPLPKEIEMVLS